MALKGISLRIAKCTDAIRVVGPGIVNASDRGHTLPQQLDTLEFFQQTPIVRTPTQACGAGRYVPLPGFKAYDVSTDFTLSAMSPDKPVIAALETHNSRALPSSYEALDERTALPLEK